MFVYDWWNLFGNHIAHSFKLKYYGEISVFKMYTRSVEQLLNDQKKVDMNQIFCFCLLFNLHTCYLAVVLFVRLN